MTDQPVIPEDNTEAPKTPEPVKAQIIIEFPAGPHTTGIVASYINVDAGQIELAAHFLGRTAESAYEQAIMQQQRKTLYLPTPGQGPTT